MHDMIKSAALADPPSPLNQRTLAALARTYDGVTAPIWIEDLAGDCLYSNAAGERCTRPANDRARFDIVDHRGLLIARLATFCN